MTVTPSRRGDAPAPRPLTRQQRDAVGHLIAGDSYHRCAERLDVSSTTVHRWATTVEPFQTAVRDGMAAVTRAQRGRLLAAHSRALDVALELLDADDDRVRLRAATELLRAVPLAALVEHADAQVELEVAAASGVVLARLRHRLGVDA